MSEEGHLIASWDDVREVWLKWPEFFEGPALDRAREGTVALASCLDELTDEQKSFLRIRIFTATAEGERSARVALSACSTVDIYGAKAHRFFNGREPLLYWKSGRRGSVIAGPDLRERLFKDLEKIYRRDGLRTAPTSIAFERGAIETDGEGTALVTRENWLRPGWNMNFDVNRLREILREDLGIERLIWIDRGLPDDPTNGQVHRVARFIAPGKVAVMESSEGASEYRGVLKAVMQSLKGQLDATGRPLELFPIPAPRVGPRRAVEAQGISHLGYLQCNKSVVVPEYEGGDRAQLTHAFQLAFPDKDLRFIKAPVAMGLGGSLHAMSLTFPRFDRS